MGSPFNVEIFDANKVRVNGKKSSAIGEKVELDGKLFFTVYSF